MMLSKLTPSTTVLDSESEASEDSSCASSIAPVPRTLCGPVINNWTPIICPNPFSLIRRNPSSPICINDTEAKAASKNKPSIPGIPKRRDSPTQKPVTTLPPLSKNARRARPKPPPTAAPPQKQAKTNSNGAVCKILDDSEIPEPPQKERPPSRRVLCAKRRKGSKDNSAAGALSPVDEPWVDLPMPKLFPDRPLSPRPTQACIDEIYKLATLSLNSRVKKTETRLPTRTASQNSETKDESSDSETDDFTDEAEFYEEIHPINFGNDNSGKKRLSSPLVDEKQQKNQVENCEASNGQNQNKEKLGENAEKNMPKEIPPKQEQSSTVFQNGFHGIPEDEAENDVEL